jgi:hypothetical protein
MQRAHIIQPGNDTVTVPCSGALATCNPSWAMALASCLISLVLTSSLSHLSAGIVQVEDREVADRSSSRPLITDLSRLTVRQQSEYLEEQAAEQEVDRLEEAEKVQ